MEMDEDQVWGEVRSACEAERWSDAMEVVRLAKSIDVRRKMHTYIADQMLHARARAARGWSIVAKGDSLRELHVYYDGLELAGICSVEVNYDAREIPRVTLGVYPDQFFVEGLPAGAVFVAPRDRDTLW